MKLFIAVRCKSCSWVHLLQTCTRILAMSQWCESFQEAQILSLFDAVRSAILKGSRLNVCLICRLVTCGIVMWGCLQFEDGASLRVEFIRLSAEEKGFYSRVSSIWTNVVHICCKRCWGTADHCHVTSLLETFLGRQFCPKHISYHHYSLGKTVTNW